MNADDNSNILNNIPRLQWACRRGMLELDVLLGNFLNEAYPALSTEDKQLFVELLKTEDPSLFAWLMGHEEVPERYAYMVNLIRQHAYTRN